MMNELQKDVDELMVWKKTFNHKQAELIAWMAMVDARHMATTRDIKNLIDGCLAMVKTEDIIGERLTVISDRIDIVNKRLRILENAK